jgi:hypothetical protein
LTEWIDSIDEEDVIPTYDELSNYRGARDLHYLEIWCTYFFPAVVGTHYFKKNATQARLSKFVTVSDEAFALTVIENFYDRWTVEAAHKAKGEACNPDSLPVAKWTDANGAVGKNGNKCGWSNDGIRQFNVHTTNVELQRSMDDSVKLENSYKSLANKIGGEMTRNEGNYNRNNEGEVVSKDDLSPLPELSKQKSSDNVETTKRKSIDNMEASRKKLNFELQTTNEDEGYNENAYEHEFEDEDYDNE